MSVQSLRAAAGAALPKRLDSLTSLRFFAAFAVFTHHFTGLGGKTGYGRSPLIFPYSEIGGHGVTFFFVLSGFLMMWVYKPGEHPGSFWWRRVGRIWPAHLAALPLAVLAYYIVAHKPIEWWSLISSVFLVQTWFPHVTPTLPGNEVTWTLSVELLFYALFPLFGWIAVRTRTRWLALATVAGLIGMWAINWLAVAYLSAPHASWVMRNPIVYLPEFLLGLTMAMALKRGWRLPVRPFIPIVLLVAYVYGYYQGRMRLPHDAVNQLDFTVRQCVAIFSALIILSFVQREMRGLRGILNTKPLVLLGLWSYSFYLIHHSISRLATYEWGRMPDTNAVLFTLLGMGLVVAGLSWALFDFVEEPAERWWRRHTPKRWLRKVDGRSVTPPRIETALIDAGHPERQDPEPEPEPATATARS
jgi:peptidoglycan/LPS O-acetylase OafA/YrhL